MQKRRKWVEVNSDDESSDSHSDDSHFGKDAMDQVKAQPDY